MTFFYCTICGFITMICPDTPCRMCGSDPNHVKVEVAVNATFTPVNA